MKKAIKKALSVMLVVVILLTAAPLSGFVGLELPDWFNLTIKSKASTLTNGSTITLGSYPQSQVTDVSLISSLDSINTPWQSYEYLDSNGSKTDYIFYKDVIFNGDKYRAVKLTKHRGYSSSNGFSLDTTYWFKYEPLTWKVLNSTTGLAVCEKVIDSQPYHHTSAKTDGYYGNNYEKSDIRKWLTCDFYNTAFNNIEKMCIKLTSVDNTATSTTYSSNNTNDYVFALSRSEASQLTTTERKPATTSYARIQGAWVYSNNNSQLWGLRTAGALKYSINYVKYGSFDRNDLDDAIHVTSMGTRPALCLNTLIDYSANDNIYDVQLGRNRLSFGEDINTTVGEDLCALLQYTADKENLSAFEITSSHPDVVEVGTISNGSNRINCGENEYSAEIKLNPKKIGSSVITVSTSNGISESVTVNVGNTIYGVLDATVWTTIEDGDSYVSDITVDGVEYPVSVEYSKQIDLINTEENYKNKEVVFVIKNGEVSWLETIDNIKTGLNATISLSTNEIYYKDKSYSTNKISANIMVQSTCLSYFPNYGDVSVLNDIDSLQATLSSLKLSISNADLISFDGEKTKTIDLASTKLQFGKNVNLATVTIDVDDSYKIPKNQANEIVGISCTILGENNGNPVSRTVATSIEIKNKNNSKPEASVDSTTTDSSNINKAAQALESAIDNNNSAVNLGGLDISGTLKHLFTSKQLDAIGAMILCQVAMASTPKDSLEQILSNKIVEEILGIDTNSFKVDVENGTLAVTVVTKTDSYGKIGVKFTCNYYNYLFANSKFGFKGDIDFEIIDGFEKLPSGYSQKGMAGMLVGADVTAFCNAAQDFALDMLNNSYSLAWGNDANNAADIIFGKSVNKILSKTKYGDVSGLIWKMLVTPALEVKIYCPVDIYVYNSNNEVVAAVEDNSVVLRNENVDISIDGDTKIVRLFDNEYRIEYHSLAEYNMKVVVSEYGFSDCLIDEKVIDNVPLRIGTEYSQNCGESEYDVIEYSLIDNNKEIYEPTSDLSAIHEHIVTDDWELIQEPTCEVYGFKAALCSICKEWCKEIIAPTGHNYVDGYCTVCGESIEENFALEAMSSQIRFDRNEDNSYAETFAVRTRAKISDDDFKALVGATNEEAARNIDKIGFVYTLDGDNFSVTAAQATAQGENMPGYTDAPINYIQDADGYYMFTCLVTDIPEADKSYTLTAYAYICVNGKWYFSEAPMNADFNSLYSTYYPKACEKYGW